MKTFSRHISFFYSLENSDKNLRPSATELLKHKMVQVEMLNDKIDPNASLFTETKILKQEGSEKSSDNLMSLLMNASIKSLDTNPPNFSLSDDEEDK